MGIINTMRRQNAIYWPPGRPDGYGRPAQGALVELVATGGVNYRVRWEDRAEDYKDANGKVKVSSAVVFVPELPDGGEVALGGWLWLGDRADLTSETNPRKNAGAYEVMRVEHIPNRRASETLRRVLL